MRISMWQRLESWQRDACPFVVSAFLILLFGMPLGLPAFSQVVPSVLSISVYYWVLHCPRVMPIGATFLLAIFQAIISGEQVGFTALIFLLFHKAVESQRRLLVDGSFWVLWMGFFLFTALAIVAEWSIIRLSHEGMLDHRSALFKGLVTVAFYPLFTWIFVLMQRMVLKS